MNYKFRSSLKIYFADAQVRGTSGGEDGVIIRCELDGSGVEIAASRNLSDPRASASSSPNVPLLYFDVLPPRATRGICWRDVAGIS